MTDENELDTVPRVEPACPYTRPNLISLWEFEGADLYDHAEEESIRFTDLGEALESLLEESVIADSGDPVKYLSTEALFLRITAYMREPVTPRQSTAWGEWHADTLREAFVDEYGGDDGDDGLSDAEEKELRRRMTDTVSWYLDQVRVYRCSNLRTWTLDNEDLLEVARHLKPEWLEPQA